MEADFDDYVDDLSDVYDGPPADSPYGEFWPNQDWTPQDPEVMFTDGLGAGDPATTQEAAEFLRQTGDQWGALCLMLQRTARHIGPLFASAAACAAAVPQANRVTWQQVRRGHVGFFDDSGDGNPYGHIAFCAGRTRDGRRLWWTNDARAYGAVDLVADPSPDRSWFGTHWGDGFTYGSNWINGVTFPVGKADPKPDKGKLREPKVREAVQALDAAERAARKAGKRRRAEQLEREAQHLRKLFLRGNRG